MSNIEFEDPEQGSVSSGQTSGIEGNPESKEGKISYGDTTSEQQKKENEGFPAGSYNESSDGGEENIIDEDDPSE